MNIDEARRRGWKDIGPCPSQPGMRIQVRTAPNRPPEYRLRPEKGKP